MSNSSADDPVSRRETIREREESRDASGGASTTRDGNDYVLSPPFAATVPPRLAPFNETSFGMFHKPSSHTEPFHHETTSPHEKQEHENNDGGNDGDNDGDMRATMRCTKLPVF
jgi:hypothetical protein